MPANHCGQPKTDRLFRAKSPSTKRFFADRIRRFDDCRETEGKGVNGLNGRTLCLRYVERDLAASSVFRAGRLCGICGFERRISDEARNAMAGSSAAHP